MTVFSKVGCVFLMVISSEFHIGRYIDDDYREDAPHFRKHGSFLIHRGVYKNLHDENPLLIHLCGFRIWSKNQIYLVTVVKAWRNSEFRNLNCSIWHFKKCLRHLTFRICMKMEFTSFFNLQRDFMKTCKMGKLSKILLNSILFYSAHANSFSVTNCSNDVSTLPDKDLRTMTQSI